MASPLIARSLGNSVTTSTRLATEADLPAIVEIYNEAIPGRTATADTTPVTVEERLEWFRKHDPSTHPIFVYEDSGQIIGWTSLSAFYGRPPTGRLLM